MRTLKGKTVFISGASRGIGLAIALRAARDGANVAIAGKTTDPHPRLPGTIHSAAAEVEAAGGRALPLVMDVRSEEEVERAIAETVRTFGGLDVLVNNASAISLTGTLDTTAKKFDLMHQVNTRGTFLCSRAAIPHLAKAENPHILNNSPPLNLAPKWFGPHVAYTIAKYGMSMCVLGMAEELRPLGIAVNALWPRTTIATSAIQMIGGEGMMAQSRKPEIMADAAHAILTRDAKTTTGRFFIDDEVLREAGVLDLSIYAHQPGATLLPDFFLDA